jgi:YD repeat-containing protein
LRSWRAAGAANGNQVTRKVGSSTYYQSYDAENRLTSVSGAANSTFAYDGDGNRIKLTLGSATKVYVGNYFEWTGGVMRKYYYANGQRVVVRDNGTPYCLLNDHLGSTAITVNGEGTTEVGELRYYPYGETRYNSGSTPTSYRFTGQREDATIGLYFYNARYYDPWWAAFSAVLASIVPSVATNCCSTSALMSPASNTDTRP